MVLGAIYMSRLAGLARLTEAPGYIVITFAKRIQLTWKAGPARLAGISLEQTGAAG